MIINIISKELNLVFSVVTIKTSRLILSVDSVESSNSLSTSIESIKASHVLRRINKVLSPGRVCFTSDVS